MKLTRCYILGRFTHKVTGQTVNIHKGIQVGRGYDIYFYLNRGKRVLIPVHEKSADWLPVARI